MNAMTGFLRGSAVRQYFLVLGTGLAVMFVAEGISKYAGASRRAAVEQRGRDLSRYSEELQREIKRSRFREDDDVSSLLERFRRQHRDQIAWVLTRNARGEITAKSGLAPASALPKELLISQLREGKAILTTRSTSAGEVVVAAFPLRLDSPRRTPALLRATFSTQGEALDLDQFAIIEIAAFMRAPESPRGIPTAPAPQWLIA